MREGGRERGRENWISTAVKKVRGIMMKWKGKMGMQKIILVA